MDDTRRILGALTCQCGFKLEVREGQNDDLISWIMDGHRASQRHVDSLDSNSEGGARRSS
jgi:hypothetical protein